MIKKRNNLGLEPGKAGFTMVELLVVIGIIGLVVAIIMPAYMKIQSDVVRKKVRSQLAGLESGCTTYRGTFGDYPPAGAANLLMYMTGKGMPISVPGGGFQVVQGGRVYGPYLDIDRMLIRLSASGLAFQDGYGGEIGYWVWDGSTFAGVANPAIANPADYASRDGKRVRDMFCASAGPDGQYSPNAWTLGTDDLITFVSEE